MTEFDKADVASEVYVLTDSDQTVSQVKSQFADEHDVPYSECNGSIIHGSGGRSYHSRSKYPARCVIIHNPEV